MSPEEVSAGPFGAALGADEPGGAARRRAERRDGGVRAWWATPRTRRTDAASIRAAVDRTRIADTGRKDVEFAVATHVEPYGCTFVCSVWVYVARLTKRA